MAPGIGWAAVVLAIWASGTVAFLISWAVRWHAFAVLARTASPLRDSREATLLRHVERALARRSPLPIVATTGEWEPGVFGVISPVLIWPTQLTNHLSDEELEAILAHELAHVRRRDNLTANLHMLVQVTFWFHPAVWWIGAQLLHERERACDEEVLAAGSEPAVYAASILRTCALSLASAPPMMAGVTGADLKRRIESVVLAQPRTPLTASRRLLLTAVSTAIVAAPVLYGTLAAVASPQAPAAAVTAAFEVAVVKENHSGEPGSRVQAQPNGRFRAVNATLQTLVRNAYRLQEPQIVGGPDWFTSERFDIEARAPEGVVSPEQFGGMLQHLIAERFNLAAHFESRELPVYTMMLVRSDRRLGNQLRGATVDCAALLARGAPPTTPASGARPSCGLRLGLGQIIAGGASISQLANALSPMVGRPVIDRTGLDGLFDIDLTWTPDQLPPRAPGTPADQPLRVNGVDIDPNGPSLYTAVQEQLGLKLDARHGPVNVLVVDRADKPIPD